MNIKDFTEEELETELERRKSLKNNLNIEFQKVAIEAMKEIKKHTDAAQASLRDAIKISEDAGIPFRASVSFLPNKYIPYTLSKWDGVDSAILQNFDIWNTSDYGGWEQSDLC